MTIFFFVNDQKSKFYSIIFFYSRKYKKTNKFLLIKKNLEDNQLIFISPEKSYKKGLYIVQLCRRFVWKNPAKKIMKLIIFIGHFYEKNFL